MDKIQIIEKLFTYLLEGSYLLLPFAFLICKTKRVKPFLFIAIYGIIFFFFLHFFYKIPYDLGKYFVTFYTFLEYTFFSFIIGYHINNKKYRSAFFYLSIVYAASLLSYLFFNTTFKKLDSIPIAIETFLIFFYIIVYFRQFFKNNITKNVYEYPSFWLIVGILTYLGSGFYFNLLVDYVTEDQFSKYWHFTYIPDIIKNLLFTMVIMGYPSVSNEYNALSIKSKDIPNLDMI